MRSSREVDTKEFDIVFAKMQEVENVEVNRLTREIAAISRPIDAVAAAVEQIEQPTFTTFASVSIG
jgi:hypothetical protein